MKWARREKMRRTERKGNSHNNKKEANVRAVAAPCATAPTLPKGSPSTPAAGDLLQQPEVSCGDTTRLCHAGHACLHTCVQLLVLLRSINADFGDPRLLGVPQLPPARCVQRLAQVLGGSTPGVAAPRPLPWRSCCESPQKAPWDGKTLSWKQRQGREMPSTTQQGRRDGEARSSSAPSLLHLATACTPGPITWGWDLPWHQQTMPKTDGQELGRDLGCWGPQSYRAPSPKNAPCAPLLRAPSSPHSPVQEDWQ